MKRRLLVRNVLVAAALTLLSSSAFATLITFDGISGGAIPGPTVFTESGFDLSMVDMFGDLGGGVGGTPEVERLFGTAGTLTRILHKKRGQALSNPL